MKIIFYGGRQSGMISLLTLRALGHEIVCAIPVDEPVEILAKALEINVQKPENINDNDFFSYLENLGAEMFFCCHGRTIIKKQILDKFLCVNLHPCLSKYPGARSVERLLNNNDNQASVGAHWMTENIDRGKIIVENFKEIASDTVIGVYNEIYPLYAKTTIDVFKILEKNNT